VGWLVYAYFKTIMVNIYNNSVVHCDIPMFLANICDILCWLKSWSLEWYALVGVLWDLLFVCSGHTESITIFEYFLQQSEVSKWSVYIPNNNSLVVALFGIHREIINVFIYKYILELNFLFWPLYYLNVVLVLYFCHNRRRYFFN